MMPLTNKPAATHRGAQNWRPGFFWTTGENLDLAEVIGPGGRRGLKKMRLYPYPYSRELEFGCPIEEIDTPSGHWAKQFGVPVPETHQAEVRRLLDRLGKPVAIPRDYEEHLAAAKAIREILGKAMTAERAEQQASKRVLL